MGHGVLGTASIKEYSWGMGWLQRGARITLMLY